jgi:glycosyltransferase involved in cell wall biosynthesis
MADRSSEGAGDIAAAPADVDRPLHVGLNLFFLVDDAGGTKTYARELIRGLLGVEPETRITAFATEQAPRAIVECDGDGRVDWVCLPGRVTGGPPWNPATSLISQWAREPVISRRRRLDVLHGLASTIAPLSAVPTVATILDIVWMHEPGAMTAADALRMRVVTKASAHYADRIVAISQAGRRDLVDTLGIDPDRIDVTPLGMRVGGRAVATSEPELRARLALGDGPLILCVAQKRVHKNLDALVRALALLGIDGAGLVLPGSPTSHEQELRALADRLGVRDRIAFLDWVSAEDLEGLYAAAGCFVLPSRIEGFGLPIVEAMAHGLPVACSNISALPEVAGDAALLFDPGDDEQIAAAIRRLLSDHDLAAELGERGRRRSLELTWERTAEATLASYRRAIAQRRR